MGLKEYELVMQTAVLVVLPQTSTPGGGGGEKARLKITTDKYFFMYIYICICLLEKWTLPQHFTNEGFNIPLSSTY